MSKQKIYLISGPLGVGKSSLCKEICKRVKNCIRLNGDALFNPLGNTQMLSWEEKLELTWKNLIYLTKSYLDKDLSVAIDFVVEEELEWFAQQLSIHDVQLHYVVLLANEKTLEARLNKRSEPQYLSRSVVLLDKLQTDLRHQQYLLDTNGMTTDQVCDEVLANSRFIVDII